MAMSASPQSFVAFSGPRVGSRSHVTGLPCVHLPPRGRAMRVRCQAEQEQPQEQTPPVSPPPQSVKNPPPTPKHPKVSTKFSDVLAFSGPAPERINGRLAMIGFVSALAVEAAQGEDLLEQVMNGGLPWFLGTAALLSVASLVPLIKGVTVQSRSSGLMTDDAEMWNGRFAMLGLVALAFTEYVKGGPLI